VGADGAGDSATLGDTLADPGTEDAYGHVLDEIAVRDFARELDERERMVLWRHYGLGWPPQTLTQIGDSLGLTAERVRQIEAGALTKLREAAAAPPEVRAT
jgi:RNA polymerase sigma factor (sigma-70 family)